MKIGKEIKICGIVMDISKRPMPYTHIKLLQKITHHKRNRYKVIQQGYTNENGEYNFKVVVKGESVYKVIAVGDDQE